MSILFCTAVVIVAILLSLLSYVYHSSFLNNLYACFWFIVKKGLLDGGRILWFVLERIAAARVFWQVCDYVLWIYKPHVRG